MSEMEQNQSVQADAQSGDAQTKDLEINRSAEDYARRTVELSSENKKMRLANAELKARLDAIDKERLEAQGKFQEVALKEKERADRAEQLAKEAAKKFGWKLVEKAVESEAARFGCVDPQALLALAPVNEIEVDEEFNIDPTGVKAVIEKMAKEKPYLFQKTAQNPRDLPPGSGKETFKAKSIKDMSIAEKKALLEQMMTKKGA